MPERISVHVDTDDRSAMPQPGVSDEGVNAGDVLELQASMIRLLSNSRKTDEVGFNGYKTIKQYGIERHLNALETLFAELQI